MSPFPEPDQTPGGPVYEGRLLDRPHEEVVDQGAAFDLRTLVSRRGLLGIVGLGLGTVALAACSPGASGAGIPSPSSSSAMTGEIPDETAGPYPGDGSNGPDALEMSGIVRSDIRTSIGGSTPVDGVPLTFTLAITDLANGGAPFVGVAVYAWHCDGQGRYSMYSQGVEDETWLRGVQVTDANGEVTFTSIVPGCYTGRWPHIHFEVYSDVDAITDSTNAIATSQLAFPEEPLNAVYAEAAYDGSAQNLSQVTLAGDNVFGDDGGELQLATVTGDVSGGYIAALTVPVDTTTQPTGGGAPGGSGAPGGGGPGDGGLGGGRGPRP